MNGHDLGSRPWVTFDMDNTLIQSPYWRLHFRPWLEAEAQRLGTDYRSLWRHFHQRSEELWRRGRWVDSFDWPAIAEHLGLSRVPEVRVSSPKPVRALVPTGVEAMLWSLRQLNVRLAIVTNGFWAFQYPYLKALGWPYLLDAVITPDRVGAAKPNPAIMVPVSPGLIHVGDRLSHDVLAARRSGRKSALVGPSSEHDHIDPLMPANLEPDWIINDWRHLPQIVASML